MKAIYDSKENINFLVKTVLKISGENMEDYVWLNMVLMFKPYAGKSNLALCFNFKHKLSKDIVHLAFFVSQMKVQFMEGEAVFSVCEFNWKHFLRQVFSLEFHENGYLQIEAKNYSFVNLCQSPYQAFCMQAILMAQPEIFQTLLRNEPLKPANYKGYFGYYLPLSSEKGLFLKAEFYEWEKPFLVLKSCKDLSVLPNEAWIEAIPQPANKHFFYYDGETFVRRLGKYVSAREASDVYEKSKKEGDCPYPAPVPVYFSERAMWIVASNDAVSLSFLVAVNVNTGRLFRIKYTDFLVEGYLAKPSDRSFS